MQQRSALDRLASFRFTYIAFVLFVILYVITVSGAEQMLTAYFRWTLTQVVQTNYDPNRRAAADIAHGVHETLRDSPWVRIGGVEVSPIVLGRDASVLYAQGPFPLGPLLGDQSARERENQRILPARLAELHLSLPHSSLLAASILVFYAAIFVSTAYIYTRRQIQQEYALLEQTRASRDQAAQRAEEIEDELLEVRKRISEAPGDTPQSEKIRQLRAERAALHSRLADVSRREEELRAESSRQNELDEEHQALEELLDEALHDLDQKNNQIEELQSQVRKASRSSGSRVREAELLGRRLRTLYKNLEFDDRAIDNLIALRDEQMKLRAEDSLKRLADDLESALVRRKVGGLPPSLAIFEMGFAGKGRIYYTIGKTRRFRILAAGAKNTQKADLEYLSRLNL